MEDTGLREEPRVHDAVEAQRSASRASSSCSKTFDLPLLLLDDRLGLIPCMRCTAGLRLQSLETPHYGVQVAAGRGRGSIGLR